MEKKNTRRVSVAVIVNAGAELAHGVLQSGPKVVWTGPARPRRQLEMAKADAAAELVRRGWRRLA